MSVTKPSAVVDTPVAHPTEEPVSAAAPNLPRKRRSRIHWPRILLEGFFVTSGVILALAADEWRQSQADRERARLALQSIREELHTNRDAVLASLNYHLHLTAVLRARALPDSGAASTQIDGSTFSKGFVSPAPLLQTAWESARSTDALRHMEYEDVLTLARIYEQQRTYEQQGREVGALIYAKLFNAGMEAMLQNVANLSTIISTFWYRECLLLSDYDRVSRELDADHGDPAPVPATCEHVVRNAAR